MLASWILIILTCVSIVWLCTNFCLALFRHFLLSEPHAWMEIERDPKDMYRLYKSRWGQYKAGCRFFWTKWSALRHWKRVQREMQEEYRWAKPSPHSFLISQRDNRYIRAIRFVRAIEKESEK